jgi:hypothetical protein
MAHVYVAQVNLPKKILMRARTAEEVREHLESRGLPADGVVARVEERGRKRTRSVERGMDVDDEDEDGEGMDDDEEAGGKRRGASLSRSQRRSKSATTSSKVRSQSATRGPSATSVAPAQRHLVQKSKKSQERQINKFARGGEADRRHYPKLVKHMNSGKRSLGTSTIGR